MISLAHNRTGPRERGDGLSAKTPIEGAARLGYLDAGSPYRQEYDTALPQWQRNYEAGRQWATAIRAIGLEPAEWPDGGRVPQALLDQLAKVRTVTGSGTRPEDTQVRPKDDPAPLHAVVPRVVRGRLLERMT